MTFHLREAMGHHNVKAFARVVRQGESSQDDEIAYKMRFPNKTFDDFSKHPDIREPISWNPGEFSTAAGAFQITGTTDRGLRRKYPFLKPSFTPEDQEERFVCLLDDCGALSYVIIGDFERAVYECVKGPVVWTSLPGGTENPQAMAKAKVVYETYGGTYDGTPSTQPAAPIDDKSTQEPHMSGLGDIITAIGPIITGINPIAGLLVSAFAPLLKEKLTREIDKHSDTPGIGSQISDVIINKAVEISGKKDPLEAVAVVRQNPEMIKQVEETVDDHLVKMQPFFDKLAQLESSQHSEYMASQEAAAHRINTDWLRKILVNANLRNLGAAVIGVVAITIVQTILSTDHKPLSELLLLLTAIVTTFINTYSKQNDFGFGSSPGSEAKNAMISELSASNKKSR